MKKISILLIIVLCCSVCFGCSFGGTVQGNDDSSLLDGKKIIFIGHSQTYWGGVVEEKATTVLEQEERKNDQGYFYQLCKENDMEVSVTNWTFGNHSLTNLFGGDCQAGRGCDGVDHASYLTDLDYDYVVMQRTSADDVDNVLTECRPIMDMFKEANPDVQFLFLVQYLAYEGQYGWTTSLKELAEEDVTVVDWGGLIHNILTGAVEVPGATQEYYKNSFVVCRSQTDGRHPNVLTGYITALMTYCALTGDSAVGQPYDFCDDAYDFSFYREKDYTYKNPETNFDAILTSEADVNGIQQLIDQHLEEKAYMNY